MEVPRRFRAGVFTRHIFAALVLGVFLVSRGYAGTQGPFTLVHSLFDPSLIGQDGGGQGHSVAMDGKIAALGCPFDDTGAFRAGVAKVYDVTTGTLLYTLTNPSPSTVPNFGWSVALSGSRVVVGATAFNFGDIFAGTVYVYDLGSSTPTAATLTLTNPAPEFGAHFGWNVAISGAHVVAAPASGSVYVYDLGSTTPAVPMLTLTNVSPSVEFYGTSIAILGDRVAVGAPAVQWGSQDAGTVYLYDLAGPAPELPALKLPNPIPGRQYNFGQAVSLYTNLVLVGAPGLGGGDVGRAFVYHLATASPTVPVITLTNNSGRVNDEFGSSVAISGTRVVIGASGDDFNGPGPFVGIAFVYELTSPTPQVPTLTVTNPSPVEFDFFGQAVAIAGTLVLVGAYGDDTAASEAGSAYVYDLASPTPAIPAATLNTPALMPNDRFGASVAISGRRVVVGARFEDTGGYDAGSVYVYDLDGPTPGVPMLSLSNSSPAELRVYNFGWSVAISGTRIAVGTYGGNRAYLYDLAGVTPAIPVTLNSPVPESNDQFGQSLAISGTRVVVGSLNANGVVIGAGRAYVYDSASPTPTVPAFTLENPTPAFIDQFGFSVAISSNRVVVGAPFDNAWAPDAGSVSLYDLSGATPTVPILNLTNPQPSASDEFGWSVAISGTRVVVGAPNDYSGPFPAGRAFVFDVASATPTVPVLTLEHPNPVDFIQFGLSVAISGTRVVVGATGEYFATPAEGEVFVYDLSSATPHIPVARLASSSLARDGQFGSSVAIDDTTIVAGAPGDDTNAQDRGAAYIFAMVNPRLRVVPRSGFATVSWSPSTGSGFVLQYTDSLANPNWVNAPSGAANPAILPTTNTARFYRLSRP